jgi:hypothetical protein
MKVLKIEKKLWEFTKPKLNKNTTTDSLNFAVHKMNK